MRTLETNAQLELLAIVGNNDDTDPGVNPDSGCLTVVFTVLTTIVVSLMVTVSVEASTCC